MNKHGMLAMNVFKLVWKLAFFTLGIVLAIASEKRARSSYTPLKAKFLHEDDLISDAQYMRSLGND